MAIRDSTRITGILKDAVKAPCPTGITPMAFKLCQAPFDHNDWQFEIKWDGFRILSYCNGNHVDLRSRKNISFDKRFSDINRELQRFNINAVLDGEVVSLDEDGCSDFSSLIAGGNECLAYYVFDLLWYNGYNVMDLPLSKRRKLLKLILPKSDIVRYSDHVDRDGKKFFDVAKKHKIEGIVAKNKYSHYIPGIRTSQWLKIKTAQVRQAFVAGLLFDKDKNGLSSLIIGVLDQDGFKYIGQVEAGMSQKDYDHIVSKARPVRKSIFTPEPKVNKQGPFRQKIKNAEIIWLDPSIKCNVKYLELDRFGMMRHASLRGVS